MHNIKDFILKNIDLCVRENKEDKDTLIGLPFPYTVPSVGHFDELYYWDTYFFNKGLQICGRMELAKNNVDNMLWLVKKYGLMPNGNRTFFLNRSQPPFLSMMVYDVYEYYKDENWLSEAFKTLETEYEFWMNKRISPIGLNHYDCTIEECEYDEWAELLAQRIGFMPDEPKEKLARHMMTVAESGWDVTPRWGFEAYNFACVELNSLMYSFEKNMAYFCDILQNGQSDIWLQHAATRCELMNKYLEKDGIFGDYNYSAQQQSTLFSAASLYPLFCGVATPSQAKAMVDSLCQLETDFGILTCEENEIDGKYQWSYPNGWACLHYVAIVGLEKYGYTDIAKRIAKKYVDIVEKIFAQTNNLWEKYNVVQGNLDVANEYGLPPMMGWSAGVYMAAEKYLNENN